MISSVFFLPLDAAFLRWIAVVVGVLVGIASIVATHMHPWPLWVAALGAALVALLALLQRDRWCAIRRHRWGWVRRQYQAACIYHLAWRLDKACAALEVVNDEADCFPGGAGAVSVAVALAAAVIVTVLATAAVSVAVAVSLGVCECGCADWCVCVCVCVCVCDCWRL
jgi:hypothetical protein